jgi:hypothetical protein
MGRGCVYHRCDPFTGMYCAVPYDTLLAFFTTATPDMDAFYVAALGGLPSRYDFRIVRVRSRKVRDPLHVIGDRMVRVEPSRTRSSTG